METPERNQIGSSVSKYENSPVFNYLSNLSPIKQVKSASITHTLTSLNFDSLPSVFTSPHAISHKESRLFRRHKSPDKLQPDVPYIDAGDNKENEVFVHVNQLHDNSNELHKYSTPLDSFGETLLKPHSNESDTPMGFHQLKYNYDTPKRDTNTRLSAGKDALQSAEAATLTTMFDQSPSTNVHEGPSGWESLASEGAHPLMLDFDSPGMATDLDALLKSPLGEFTGPSRASQFPQDTTHFLKLVPEFLVDDICELQNENHFEFEGINSGHGVDGYPTTMTKCVTSHPGENANDEPKTSLHRGGKRKCLVFNTQQAGRNVVLGDSTTNPSICTLLDQKISSKNRKRMPNNTSSLCVVPGIGLHLNSLAVSRDCDFGVQNTVSSSVTSFQSPTTAQESIHDVEGASAEENVDPDIVQGAEDASLELDLVFKQKSPMKKRHREESSGDESCKHCNCKKSKCLKLYCECFAAGVYCIGSCACKGCLNKDIHKDIVLATRKQIESRNPLAFAPKVIMASNSFLDDQVLSTPASARHKRGCNCKKSGCSKKYCECYQGGVGCSIDCRCESCMNVFGTKDGKVPAPVARQEDDDYEVETEKVRKKTNTRCLLKPLSLNNGEHEANSFLQTPRITRTSVQLPVSSKGKPTRSSFLSDGSASSIQFHKPNHFNPRPNLPASEDDTRMPDILQRNGSPDGNVKTSSPNSKRSPSLNSNIGSSYARRSTRKLILQSIPSFPSLNQP